MNKWLKIVQHFLAGCLQLPCICVLCLEPAQRDIALCKSCENTLPWLTHTCRRCGITTPQNELCSQCQYNPPLFDSLQALFDYQWPVNAFIGQLKYGSKLHFAKMLGSLMATRLFVVNPIDCILPVPLHPNRQAQRGFNQSLELACVIAKQRHLPLDRWSCTKTLDIAPQSLLPAARRKQNITAKAFHIAPSFNARHVLVIEDVVTTGATMQALTSVLKRHGVVTVEIWSVCRTHL